MLEDEPVPTPGTEVTVPEDESPAAAQAREVVAMRESILRKLYYQVGKNRIAANNRDWYVSVALAVRDRVVDGWHRSTDKAYASGAKRVYYMSLEFLIGRQLRDDLSNLGLYEVAKLALDELGVDFNAIRAMEPDAALGNGGLGRLAACYLESMSSLAIPAFGYGIRYDHGLFRQIVKNGFQQEYPEDWLALANPWQFERAEITYDIGFGGAVDSVDQSDSMVQYVWHPAERVSAIAYDIPIVGWHGRHVNTLRLWSARAIDPIRLDAFNLGDHVGAISERARVEAISRVLYPSDETPAGQELRLRQEYFFVAASLQDMVRRHMKSFGDLDSLPDKAAIQLNDTHPSIAVVELMRILVDIHNKPWEAAWDIVNRTFCYTNHTLLPEALESWPVSLMERLLPRHMQIIYMINVMHLDNVKQKHPEDTALLSTLSLVDETHGRRVRMGHLAFLGSHSINGVSALHTELMKQTVFHEFHEMFPTRINNKTNGITFRRWLYQCNPALTALLVDAVGPTILDDETMFTKLKPLADDAAFQDRFALVKTDNKVALAKLVRDQLQVRLDPSAMFDIQIKRIHEYKRQLLNILETIALYNAIRAQPMRDWTPRVKIFAGKAAPSYHRAKLIIKLAHDVARVINSDPTLRDALKVVFLPNYNVSLAEVIIPAADLSEQISTAGMEASGTGNMKLGLNGALTIGTLDGANVEMLERVGNDNMFIFGMTAAEVDARRRQTIDSSDFIAKSVVLSEVLTAVEHGNFSPDEPGRYRELIQAIRYHDYFLVCADFDAYYACQRDVAAKWRKPAEWRRSAVLNTAGMGWFSSDRAIREYATELWNVPTWPDR
ncbi:glycogen/starch/alpha-glucan phosphorylase [Acidisoma cladoniae]|jgi:starch phosphorylase|uniref:glycogen/starch/alpha-glucan phosphorylase n=1 Tax=Acidisoma cladoniae TaxID=3040935 RepID=UPI003D9CA8E6